MRIFLHQSQFSVHKLFVEKKIEKSLIWIYLTTQSDDERAHTCEIWIINFKVENCSNLTRPVKSVMISYVSQLMHSSVLHDLFGYDDDNNKLVTIK